MLKKKGITECEQIIMNYEYLLIKISQKSTDTLELLVLTFSVVKQPDII